MIINKRMISTGLPGLIMASFLITGCSQNEPRDDYEIHAAPSEVIKGEGTGILADISIPAASMFEFDKAEINEGGKAVIEEYRKTLGPELTEAYLVLIVGHADSSGDAGYNRALSLKRAESVADYLISTGVDPEIIRVLGRGSDEPIASNETREGRIQNRRVDILVVAEVRALDKMILPSAALFEPRSSDLNEQGRALLEVSRIDAGAMLSDALYIEIVGHTDSVGDEKDNMVLSKQRAATVRDYLISKGLDADIMVAMGMGETMPIASNDTEEGRKENRRVEILMLGRIKE